MVNYPPNYQKICLDLLENLPQRQREIILRRFGLSAKTSGQGTAKRETLELIGKAYGITRERVRQIEGDGLSRLKPKIKQYQKTFQEFENYFRNKGDLKREDILLEELGSSRWNPQIYFLLTLGPNFERVGESKDFYPFWTINQKALPLAKKTINSFYNRLKKINRPLAITAFNPPRPLPQAALISYLEISKIIEKNQEGLFGLSHWPEINPRGIKDQAFLVFKKENKPLHFGQVAKLIGQSALPQTVHNELIRDPRFVLVGRGLYALKEWGYEPGYVRDVISKVLKDNKRPLTKEEILEEVSKQRLVKENTIFLNLSNKKYFLKTPQGYTIRRA
jgi:hypothetical protein